MKKIVFIILLFCSFQSFGQNRFPSIDSAKNYTLRYIRNSTLEAFSNYRMQNVAYGTLELIDSLAGAGVVDSIWKTSGGGVDTLKYRVAGLTVVVGTFSGGGGSSSWGSITGTLSSQTDLQTALNGKLSTGLAFLLSDTASKTWAWTDITGAPSFITNIPTDTSVSINNRINTKLSNITGLVTAGSNVTVTGSGTSGSPYVVSASGGGGSGVDSVYKRRDTTISYKNSTEHIVSVDDKYYGILYNTNTWSGTGDFTNAGSTVSVVSNKLQFSGGANTFTQSLGLTPQSMLENWTVTAKVKVDEKNGTSYGFGVGVRSTNAYSASNLVARFNATNGAGTGTVSIYSSASNTLVATSTSALTFSVNDYIVVTIEKSGGEVIAKAYNATTNSAPISVSYQYDYFQGSTTSSNTGRYSIFSFGGQFTVDSLAVFSKEIRNPDLLVIGDSKTVGFNAENYGQGYGQMLKTKYPRTVIHAGISDRLVEALLSLDEIIALKPKQVLIAIGSNDIRSARSSTDYLADYDTLTNRLTAAGIYVFPLAPFYETNVDVTTLYNHVASNYASTLIQTYTPTRLTGSLAVDNIHLTPVAHQLVYETIINSGKLYGQTLKTSATEGAILYGGVGGGISYNKNYSYDAVNNQMKFGSKARLGTTSGGYGALNLRGENISTANVETLLQVGNDLYVGRPTGGAFYLREGTNTHLTIASGGVATFSTGVISSYNVISSGFGYFWGTTGSGYSIVGTTGGGAMAFNVNSAERIRIESDGRLKVFHRFQTAKGANVASAGDLTLGNDGNVFHITGTTTINAITTTNWQAGSEIILIFDASVTVKNNTAGGANTAIMNLAGAADFSATANDVLRLVFDGTSFYEVSRSVN